MPPLRIAILECDTPLTNTRTKYGGYGGVFTQLLKSGTEQLKKEGTDVELELSTWDVVEKQEYPKLEDVDAVLLTGSKHNSFDSHPWILRLVEFTRHILQEQSRVRVIGVCFGHQIVGRALGAKVARGEHGWEVSVTPLELTSLGKNLFGVQNMSLHQMHQDVVFDYPVGVEPLAHTTRCTNQGMYAKNRLITVQGHPEFTRDIVREILEARHKVGVFGEEMYQDGMRRTGDTHDGVIVGTAFLRFALEDGTEEYLK